MERLPTLDSECFFIAPIGEEGSPIRKRSDGVLQFIVDRAAEELGLEAVRADKIAEPGQITLQVIDHVLGARAAVADLTGQNPNVFYELAVRHTARLPVVLIADKGEQLPFDIAQMRTVFFDHTDLQSADECRAQIVAHLRQALEGAVDSPIATSIDVRALQSGNTVERNIAELVTSVEELARGQRESQMYVMRLAEVVGHQTGGDPETTEAIRFALARIAELEESLKSHDADDCLPTLRQVRAPLEFALDPSMRRMAGTAFPRRLRIDRERTAAERERLAAEREREQRRAEPATADSSIRVEES